MMRTLAKLFRIDTIKTHVSRSRHLTQFLVTKLKIMGPILYWTHTSYNIIITDWHPRLPISD